MGFPHLQLHVDPGAVGPLDIGVIEGFYQGVEHLITEIAHADLVRIGKRETDARQVHGCVFDGQASPLAPGVSPGALDPREKRPEAFSHFFECHVVIDSSKNAAAQCGGDSVS